MPYKKAVNSLTTVVKEYLKIKWQEYHSNDGNEIHEKEDLFESIIKKFMSFETVSKNYTDLDIEILLHQSIIFKKPPFEITDEFVENVVNSFFEKMAEDCVYVPLEDVDGFPSKYKIGACNIITSEEVPQGIKHVISIAEKNISSESSLPKYWIYTKLDSIGQMKQQEEIFYKIDEALAILRIASVGTGFSCPLFVRKYHIYNSKTRMHRVSSYTISSCFPYWEELDKTIKDYANLFYKERKSPIESTVINALKIYSLHINQ